MERNKILLLAVKVAVFVLMAWIIADRLFLSADFGEQWALFKKNLEGSNITFFVIAFLLMPVNWGMEALKWKTLLQLEAPFFSFLKSVVAGATFGFVTPARTGEFVGRVFYIDGVNKTRAFYLSALGGIAQTAITLTTGTILIALWRNDPFMTGLATGVGAVFLFFYFRYDILSGLAAKIPFLQKKQWVVEASDLPDKTVLGKVLTIGFFRYTIYIAQYVSLALFFGVSEDVWALFVRCGVYMVVQTFSPLMPSVDVTYRGGTALAIFEDVSANALGIVSVSFFGWFINLCIPSVLGYFFLLRKK